MKINFEIGQKNNEEIVFHPSDFWNLDITLAHIICPALKQFKKRSGGHHPASLTYETWTGILDQMILAFELVVKSNEGMLEKEEQAKIDEGLAFFAKYYQALWT